MRAHLARTAKKFAAASDEELQAKVEELQGERRALAREHRGPFPEDAHARLDELIAEARTALERGLSAAAAGGLMLMQTPLAPGRSLAEMAGLDRVAHDPAFEARIRSAIDRAPAPPLSKAKLTEKLSRLDDDVEALEVELKRRAIELRRAEVDAELAGLGGAA